MEQIILAQNLYQNSVGNSSVQSSAAANTVQTVSSETLSANTSNNFDIFNAIVINLNIFMIIWSVIVSFILISNFYFYYKLQSDKNVSREETGEKSLWLSQNIWLRYLLNILFFGLFVFVGGWAKYVFFVLFILSCLIKWYFDILDLLKNNEYFSWFDDISKNLTKLLTLNTKKK